MPIRFRKPEPTVRRGSRSAAPIVRFTAVLLLLLSATTACLPIPDLRLPPVVPPITYQVAPSRVQVETALQRGYDDPATPDRYDRVALLRYRLPGAEDAPQRLIVAMPGLFGGAASFDGLARQLVAALPATEVWAIDRRSNLLEDRSGFLAAIEAGDPDLARRYYLGDDATPPSFRPLAPDEVPFMRGWGLELHLRDLDAVVRAARARVVPGGEVLLLGHSLGASLVALYAAFEVAPGRYGHQAVDGLVLLDGSLGRTGAYRRPDSGLRFGPFELLPGSEGLSEGRGNPYIDFGLGPAIFIENDVEALYAVLDPDGDSPFGDYPASNLARYGIGSDDTYAVVPLFFPSLGEVEGASFSGNLPAFLLGGVEGAGSRTVTGLAEGADRVEWVPGDPLRERTDIRAYARSHALRGASYTEWYFPLRLLIDITLLDPRLELAPGFLPNREVPTPTLALGAGRGLVPGLEGFSTYVNVRFGQPVTALILPGLTHIDIVGARDNPVVAALAAWLGVL